MWKAPGKRGDGTGWGKSIPTAADIVAGERSFPGNCDRERLIESIGVVGGLTAAAVVVERIRIGNILEESSLQKAVS